MAGNSLLWGAAVRVFAAGVQCAPPCSTLSFRCHAGSRAAVQQFVPHCARDDTPIANSPMPCHPGRGREPESRDPGLQRAVFAALVSVPRWVPCLQCSTSCCIAHGMTPHLYTKQSVSSRPRARAREPGPRVAARGVRRCDFGATMGPVSATQHCVLHRARDDTSILRAG
jgi:hypothetical protein